MKTCFEVLYKYIILGFKLPPCFECYILSFGWFPGIWILCDDVSEHRSTFTGGVSRKNTTNISFQTKPLGRVMSYRFINDVLIDVRVYILVIINSLFSEMPTRTVKFLCFWLMYVDFVACRYEMTECRIQKTAMLKVWERAVRCT